MNKSHGRICTKEFLNFKKSVNIKNVIALSNHRKKICGSLFLVKIRFTNNHNHIKQSFFMTKTFNRSKRKDKYFSDFDKKKN